MTDRLRGFSKKKLFVLDELALLLAYFGALLIRYREKFHTWDEIYDHIYVTLAIFVVLVQAIIFLAYDARRVGDFVNDRIQNVATIIKGRIMLFIAVIIYLYVLQQGENSSRFVIAAFIGLDMLFVYFFRVIAIRRYLKRVGNVKKGVLELWAPFPSDDEVKQLVKSGNFAKALIHSAQTDMKLFDTSSNQDQTDASTKDNACDLKEDMDRVIRTLEGCGLHPYVALNAMDYQVRGGIVSDVKDYAAVPFAVRAEKCDVFGIHYAVARTEEAVLHVKRHIKELAGQYICFSNVHTSVMGKENADYRKVLNEAAFVFPDGNPIAQFQDKEGFELSERVAGPDFMEHMFRATADGSLSHFFYGASQETLDELKKNLEEKYPGIVIKGMFSPPFRPLIEEEDKSHIEMINNSGADIVWIGLGAPKQEKWMNAHKGQIRGVMMGVGAGFDFHAGTIKRAPKWIQNIGFEWLYRLFQDPRRLVKRYLVTNIKYLWYQTLDKLKK